MSDGMGAGASAGTVYHRGEVVLVPIYFTDGSGGKVRPALVVSSDEYNTTSPDIMIASITSNRNAVPHPGDYPIQDWKGANLLKPSLLQAKLATVETGTIRRKLGDLQTADLASFDAGLREALGL